MAHVGKYYRLAFRRDFNISLDSNRTGLAYEYVVPIGNLFGPLGVDVKSRTYRCVADQQPKDNKPIWRSGEFFFSTYRYRVLLTATFDTPTGSTWLYMSVSDATRGKLYEQPLHWAYRGSAYWAYYDIAPPTIETPGVIFSGPLAPLASASAIDWQGQIPTYLPVTRPPLPQNP